MFFYGGFRIFLNLYHCLCFSYNFIFLYSLVFFVLAFTMRAMFTVYWCLQFIGLCFLQNYMRLYRE